MESHKGMNWHDTGRSSKRRGTGKEGSRETGGKAQESTEALKQPALGKIVNCAAVLRVFGSCAPRIVALDLSVPASV